MRLLGHPRIEDGAGQPRQPPRGQKSWALLARVALAERPLTRGELAAELFGEADDPLGALRWCLADLRRCCEDPQLLRGDPVSLAPGSLWLDVWALWDGSLPAAEIGGELLAGVEPRNCPAFDMWLMLARGRCAARSMEELRQAALRSLAAGDAEAAAEAAGRAAALDPLDEDAQELFLRTLVAAGHPARAAVHLASCEAALAREGIVPSAALRAAARPSPAAPAAGLRASVVAGSLLRSGTAALDAGSADAGIETLRRAAEEAERARDPLLHADVLRTLGSALVHSVRGFDGEGAVVLHRALAGREDRGQPEPGRRHPAGARVRGPAGRAAYVGGPRAARGIGAGRRRRRSGPERGCAGDPRHERGGPGPPRHRRPAARRVRADRAARRAAAGRKPGQPGSWPARCCSPGRWSRPARPRSAASRSATGSGGMPSCPGRRRCGRTAWPRTGSGTRRATTPSRRSRWPASWATRAGRGWPGGPWRCWRCTRPGTRRRPRSGSPMPGGAVTGCPTATSGSPGSSRSATWRSPRACSPIWSCPLARRLYQEAAADRPARVHRLGAGLPGRGRRYSQPAAGPGGGQPSRQPRLAGKSCRA